jgi:Rieske Fe-S protein
VDLVYTRREFIKLAGTTVACTCIGALGASGCAGKPTSDTPPAPEGSIRLQDGRVYVALSKVGTLLAVGGAVKHTLEGMDGLERKLIIIRPGETDYRAFADACTHNGKELNYLHGAGSLTCCGRRSQFDLAGYVIRGPAEEALLQYRLWGEGSKLIIELKAVS